MIVVITRHRSRGWEWYLKGTKNLVGAREAAVTKIAGYLVAFATLIATPVLAADMAAKAPPPAPAPSYNWTGFYVGFRAGYAWDGDPTVSCTPNGQRFHVRRRTGRHVRTARDFRHQRRADRYPGGLQLATRPALAGRGGKRFQLDRHGRDRRIELFYRRQAAGGLDFSGE